jgi:hypothetical protein
MGMREDDGETHRYSTVTVAFPLVAVAIRGMNTIVEMRKGTYYLRRRECSIFISMGL